MRSSALKHIRTIIAVMVLLLFTFIFTDFRGVTGQHLFGSILYLQFVPSLIKFIIAGVAAATGFIVIIVLTLLTGRTYCSLLCPLGIFQDVISRVGGVIKRKFRRYGYKKPYTVVRYGILVLTAGIAATGGIFVLTVLDPYSIFGRMMSCFGQPVVLVLNNLFSSLLGNFDIYTLYRVDIKAFELAAYIVPASFLIFIVLLALPYGRLYCNTVCPVGTFLGLLSKVSLFRVRFDTGNCTRCGRCAMVCKSSCIDFLNGHVDLSRCVSCFNCIDVCKEDAMSYGPVRLHAASGGNGKSDPSRRNFITGVLVLAGGTSHLLQGQGAAPTPESESTVREDRLYPVSPPGSYSLASFTSRCTACSLCVTACPTKVLQPSVGEYGIAGIMQPRMDYHSGFCNYDCTRCTDACPTGAIMPLAVEAKRLVQIGKAVFIRDNCIVHTEKTACGACSEHCPTKACQMVPYEGRLMIPEVEDEICIGCGACEYACPTTPYKAIFVDGNPIHQIADKPGEEEREEALTDFPF